MSRRTGFITLLACIAASLLGSVAVATEFRSGSAVNVKDAEILDDVMAWGDDLSFDGHVLGDVIAGGRTVTLGDSGVVDNSFMSFAQKVDVNGHVVNTARVFAQDFTLRGHIEGNVMAYAQSILIDTRAWVEKDVQFGSGQLIMRGRIGGNLEGGAATVTISGQIDGDARIESDKIVVLQGAIIGGRLLYASKNEPKVEDGAQILGGVERIEDNEKEESEGYTIGSFFWDTWWYLSGVALGFVLLAIFRRFMLETASAISDSTLKTLGLGVLFLICLPIAAIAAALTLIGVPIAMLLVLLWVVLLGISDIIVGMALGHWILTRRITGPIQRPFLAMSLGLLIITILTSIPIAGWFIGLIVVILAMGAFFLAAHTIRSAKTANGV